MRKEFEFLLKETGPKVLVEAVKLYGVKETEGSKSNPQILQWAKDLNIKEYNDDAIPWCLDGETIVDTLDGHKFIKEIQEGLEFVLTKEGEFHKVNKLLTRPKQLHKVFITGALPMLVTSDHPFLIKKCIKYSNKKQYRIYNNELEWVKFEDIKEGDLLCKPKCKFLVKSFLDEYPKEFIELLGTYTAEGTSRKQVKGDKNKNIRSRSASCCLHIGKHEIEKISNLIEKSGLKSYSITERRTCYQIEIRDKEFVNICLMISSNGLIKKVPYLILNGTEYVKFNFLKGYLNGDGTYNDKTSTGSACSISKVLIQGIGKLLNDKGLFTTFREDLRAGESTIEGRIVNIKDRYIVNYVNKPNSRKQYLEDDSYYYLPIRKVDYDFKEDIVYDLEVEGVSNFIANGLVVHNCGLFIAKVVSNAGKDIVKNPLWAQNWLNYGTKVDEAMLGDILVFKRTGGGHVAIYVGEDSTRYYCLGGNQGDEVNIVPILKMRCIGIRRTKWSIAQPASVRKVIVKLNDRASSNEL